jgi:hypothetical protein
MKIILAELFETPSGNLIARVLHPKKQLCLLFNKKRGCFARFTVHETITLRPGDEVPPEIVDRPNNDVIGAGECATSRVRDQLKGGRSVRVRVVRVKKNLLDSTI